MDNLMNVGLPLLLLVMAFIPVEREQVESSQAVDFIYVLLLFTLLILLVLGSLAFMTLGHVLYIEALLRTLFIIALTLLVLGGLWNPRMGFAGLQALFSRYLLTLGTPLEVWLKQLAEAAQQEQNPETFLARATEYLIEMPWITGLSWASDRGHGTLGVASMHRIEMSDQDLTLTLFSRQAVSPTVLLHVRLLIQLLGHFYQAKRREQHLREITRLQTIYETGARLTHDLKNMLQSLFALTSVAQHQPDKAQPILQRQLPVLTQRIELILAKLKSPHVQEDAAELPLEIWWESLRQRHQHRDIKWVFDSQSAAPTLTLPQRERGFTQQNATPVPSPLAGEGINDALRFADSLSHRERGFTQQSATPVPSPLAGEGINDALHFADSLSHRGRAGVGEHPQPQPQNNAHLIPAPLFDCVADNLIDNACNKQLREPGISISVTLCAAPFMLSVGDSGSAIPDAAARQLMHTILPSEDGLGVGLYQVSRWAAQSGYQLALAENTAGKVRFELTQAT